MKNTFTRKEEGRKEEGKKEGKGAGGIVNKGIVNDRLKKPIERNVICKA